MTFRWVPTLVGLLLVLASISCSNNNNSSATSGTGYLWLTAQGNTTVQAYTVNLSSGSLSQNGNAAITGNAPSSIVITPKGDAVFIANSGTTAPTSAGGISAYTVNTDGTLKLAGNTASGGQTPIGLATDLAEKFLFAANQGSFDLTQPGAQPGSISVFSISGTSLTPVAGSPFSTETLGATVGTGPVSVAVSTSGNYLYVANQFANTVSSFQISSSGALTPLITYSVGTSPSAVFMSVGQGTTPRGAYLYVANTGSNNISAFSVCDAQNASGCSMPNGFLAPVTGSPFPAQPGPVAIAMDPSAPFLYATDSQANQISQYSWSSGTGALTALSPATISAGGNPVSLAIRTGVAGTTTTNGTAGIDYMYVANLNGSSLSVFSLNTSTGQLNVSGSPVTTSSQPSAVTVR